MKILMMVDNAIIGDSRVQKSANSAANLGHEVLLLGRNLGDPTLPRDMESVHIVRVDVMDDITEYNLEFTRRSLRTLLAYRSRLEVGHATTRLKMRKHEIALKRAQGKSIFLPRIFERIAAVSFSVRRGQFSRSWESKQDHVSWLDQFRAFRYRLTSRPLLLFKLAPTLFEYESAYLKVAQDFQPDIIHAHDYRMAGAGVRIADILGQKGKRPKVVYDAHEFLEGISGIRRSTLIGLLLNESVAAHSADAIITVSDDIAELLVAKYQLKTRPTVVLNAPTVDTNATCSRRIREECGVDANVPLGVYLGGLAKKRGISPVLEAMKNIPELHFAFVANMNSYASLFLDEAEEFGIRDRVHLVPYVSPNEIVEFVRPCTFGLAPYLHDINHEVSLPSKFYEYAAAGLPIVGSDVKVVKRTIEDYKIGEVFTAGDSVSLTSAIRALLNNEAEYRAHYSDTPVEEWTWAAQERNLGELYDKLSVHND